MKRVLLLFVILFLFLSFSRIGFASTLSVSPPTGTFNTGDTFTASILLDTQGKTINAVQVFLKFPPDKLQVVSPSTGTSIIDVWTAPPRFNNVTGTLTLEGGIPRGIVTSRGVLTNVVFRVKSIGDAVIKFQTESAVYLHDGLATDDLHQTKNAVYTLKLPPPKGPVVTSETHPDQAVWYSNKNVVLRFGENSGAVEDFSYILSDDPTTIPDNIGEGTNQSIEYTSIADGVHYFHVKALRQGIWGGTTHFTIRVDTTPPAAFPLEILPGKHTSSTQPVIQFRTTDASSGLDRYEIKIVPLSRPGSLGDEGKESEINFFTEATSPFVTSPLELGSYDSIVRAYDHAGNYREITERLTISTSYFRLFTSEGIQITESFLIRWRWIWIFGAILLLILLGFAYHTYRWHRAIHKAQENKELPSDVAEKLEELKVYQAKYGAKTVVILLLLGSMCGFTQGVYAARIELAPPLIDTISKDISNKEIFYIGGRTDVSNESNTLYIQNVNTGETFSETIISDSHGDWFYRHNGFLSPGEYVLWAQSKHGEIHSPPSAKVHMAVKKAAIEFGSSRLTYETIYLIIALILFAAVIGLALFIFFHIYLGRKKHFAFQEEIRKLEESVRLDFALLQKDIAAELAVLQKTNATGIISPEDRMKEMELLRDLNDISSRIGREVNYLEQIEAKAQ